MNVLSTNSPIPGKALNNNIKVPPSKAEGIRLLCKNGIFVLIMFPTRMPKAIILNCIKVFHTSGIAKDFIISIITYTFLNSKNSKIFYNVK